MADQPLPPAAALVVHRVADFDTWKAAFDDHEPARRDAGILGHHINRNQDDPNVVSIYLALSDLAAAEAFAVSAELADVMHAAGVEAPPVISWMAPVRESVVWEGEHPAVVISHEVADFDRWLKGYDEADELRRSRGIIGHAANRSLDDPSLVIVYHQADYFDPLQEFIESPALLAAMEDAGVTSDPVVLYQMGGWGKQYA
jgi:hypothetical protein